MGGGARHTGHDGAQALSKLGWAGASPKAHTFPPKPEAQGQDHEVAGHGGGPDNRAGERDNQNGTRHLWPFRNLPTAEEGSGTSWDSFGYFYSPERALIVRPS